MDPPLDLWTIKELLEFKLDLFEYCTCQLLRPSGFIPAITYSGFSHTTIGADILFLAASAAPAKKVNSPP